MSDFQNGYEAGLNDSGELFRFPEDQAEYDRGYEAGRREKEKRQHEEDVEDERRNYEQQRDSEREYERSSASVSDQEIESEADRLQPQFNEALSYARRTLNAPSATAKEVRALKVMVEYMKANAARFDAKLFGIYADKLRRAEYDERNTKSGCLAVLTVAMLVSALLYTAVRLTT